MTTSNTGPFGRFRYACEADTWWWSDPLYEIHGFIPGEVVPTTELVLSHKHPDDSEVAAATIGAVMATGEDFALWHRIIDAHRKIRQVLSVGEGVRGGDGRLTEVRGYMVDLTEFQRHAAARDVDEAVQASAESREVIEQVKGALMVGYGLDADGAFELLRRYSQLTNVKVRDVAGTLTDEFTRTGAVPASARELFNGLVAESGDSVDAPVRRGDPPPR